MYKSLSLPSGVDSALRSCVTKPSQLQDRKTQKGSKSTQSQITNLDYLNPLRDGPLEKLWGGGEFSSRRNFFRHQILCMNFF